MPYDTILRDNGLTLLEAWLEDFIVMNSLYSRIKPLDFDFCLLFEK